ncbi:MAG: chaperone protein DnaK [Candidatus Dojkabacteria bacterium]|nr:MAG: chaperone protein DnaK [Candidatus Dojkabacteria bacterium]
MEGKFDDPEVQKDISNFPFKVRKSSKGGVEIQFGDKWVAPEVISARVLAKIKADAEAYLGESVTDAVITVPAYFDDAQRQATKNAGKIAGLNVRRIINEPTAAAIAYGLDKKDKEQTIAVYDLGGGTFDITILEIGDGVYEVLSTNGDTHLGGDDFDQVLIDHMVDVFKKEHGIDLKEDPAALQRLKEAAEKAKITLSSSEKTEINLPYITADSKGPKHFKMSLTRSEYEKLVMHLVEKTLKPVEDALKDAGKTKSEIDEVIMVGGMTRMPLIVKKVEEFFGKKPNQSVNPDEVVAVGAALQGAVLAGDSSVEDITLLDVTPLSLGIEVNGGEMYVLIPRNTTIPVEKSEDRFTTGVDNQPAIDVRILQGERPLAKDNKELGVIHLEVPPAPRGVPRFEITFKIDANGILNVKAKDLGTGKEKDVTITASTHLDEEEIEKLVKEAAENEARDKEELERLKIRNEADTTVWQAEKMLKDYADKIDEINRKDLEAKIQEVKDELNKTEVDKDALKSKLTNLEETIQRVGSEIYKYQDSNDKDSGKEKDSNDRKDDQSKDAEEGEIV